MSAHMRVRLSVTGVVQGVGFRPTVARIAAEHRLGGFVRNDEGSVQCELEGPGPRVEAAVSVLRTAPPPLAHIDSFVVERRPVVGDRVFRILDSTPGGGDGSRTLASPDIATCPDCVRELFDPADRRHRHPFITCTNCGPRYTVITDLPYDRPATTMASFPMCSACAAEYTDPSDRRYHAQTIACPECGPRLRWTGTDAGTALESAAAALQNGSIVAIKGVGGYHLACRADDDRAVALLRQRKNRPAKPFALMVADVRQARRICVVDGAAVRSLTSPAAPIVLLAARPGSVSAGVAPGLGDLGVMLAYTPIHHLLFAELDVPALVMTSANQGGSPIVYRAENLDWIDGLADAVLDHDRPIHVPCEDSVVSIDAHGEEIPLRRSRGYAPLPVALAAGAGGPILATGGDLKTAFALTDRGGRVHLSSHLGDMADPRTQDCFTSAVDHLASLTAAAPAMVVHDLHPRYATTRWARRRGLPALAVQHHYAHAMSLLAEHRRLAEPMIAVAYDGTGFGTDGTIWGGELLAITGPAQFTRVGHLAPFWLPGGEGAVREPARIALDLLRRAGVEPADDLPPVAALGPAGMHVLSQQLPRGVGCVPTTSMGRLFDAVASLLGACQNVTYEGQAAVQLEHLARSGRRCVTAQFDVTSGLLDPAPVIAALVEGVRAGHPRADLARTFHDAVIGATVRAAAEAAADAGVGTVGLTGGVFANRLLLTGIAGGLRARGLEVLTHRVVPCNDGGLALGQAVVAALSATGSRERSEPCVSGYLAR
ncbi:MAG: carbamoyltransferase HypF [Actinomycetota bacterium]